MTPDRPRRIPPDVARHLADISARVEPIAVRTATGTDLNVLAHAIHNLVLVIEKLHGDD